MTATSAYLEVGSRRVFACSVDWPGWCRSGKTEEQALEVFAAYAARYTPVAARAGMAFPAAAADDVEVVERLRGSGGTDFGVPSEIPAVDRRPVDEGEAARLAALVASSWDAFDDVVAGAPAVLRKGPRGGGRDRDKIVQHVAEAEASYLRKIGLKVKPPTDEAGLTAIRAEVLTVLGRPSDGEPLAPKGWPHCYAARRIAWHVLDHAWEIEDRAQP